FSRADAFVFGECDANHSGCASRVTIKKVWVDVGLKNRHRCLQRRHKLLDRSGAGAAGGGLARGGSLSRGSNCIAEKVGEVAEIIGGAHVRLAFCAALISSDSIAFSSVGLGCQIAPFASAATYSPRAWRQRRISPAALLPRASM